MFKEITAISKNYAIVKIDNVINDESYETGILYFDCFSFSGLL